MDRVDKLVTDDNDKASERNHVKSALNANGYKPWMYKTPKAKKPKTKDTLDTSTGKNVSIPLPYVKGLSEKLTHIFQDHGVRTYHKPINTIRSFLVHPKDKTPDHNKCGVIYKVQCPACTDFYVGETSRTLGTRFKEHCNLKTATLTAVAEHSKTHRHSINTDNVSVVAREDQFWKRKIRESIEIRTLKPTMNRDTGYDLPAIYNDLLTASCDRPKNGHVIGDQ